MVPTDCILEPPNDSLCSILPEVEAVVWVLQDAYIIQHPDVISLSFCNSTPKITITHRTDEAEGQALVVISSSYQDNGS